MKRRDFFKFSSAFVAVFFMPKSRKVEAVTIDTSSPVTVDVPIDYDLLYKGSSGHHREAQRLYNDQLSVTIEEMEIRRKNDIIFYQGKSAQWED